MSVEMDGAVHGLIETFANLDFRGAPTYCIMLIIALFICMEGIKFYKMILYGAAFVMGFRLSHDYLWAYIPSNELLLMVEVGAGLLLAVLAWRIYLLGVAMIVYQFARYNLRDFFEGPFAVLICIAVSVLIALISIKLNRAVIVIITAVIGGFAAVNIFVQLINVFPINLDAFPGAQHPVWLLAKIFLSAAGVGIQDVRDT